MLLFFNIFVDKDENANYIKVMKDENANKPINVRIKLSNYEKREAKKFAKDKGFTFQGWLGNLVRKEINNEDLRANTNLIDGNSNVETFRKD